MLAETIPLICDVIEEAHAKSKGLTIDEAAQLVSDECRQSLKASPLWYNSGSRVEAIALHPKPNRTGSHLITLIDYALPNWQNYPPRSESFLLTSKPIHNIAHRAFPVDGAQLVIAPSLYFGSCFKTALERLNLAAVSYFDSTFEVLHSVLNAWSKRKEGKGIGANLSSKQMEQFLINAQELLNNWHNHELMFDRAAEQVDHPEDVKSKAKVVLTSILKAGNGELIAGLNRIFDPDVNGFELKSISEFNNNKNCEIWTTSPCVMVRNDILGDL